MLLLSNIENIRAALPYGWTSTHWRNARMLDVVRAFRADVVLINCDPAATLWWCLLGHLPFMRFRLVSADIVLMAPVGPMGRIAAMVKRLLLRRVDLFVLVHKNIAGYRRHYGIGPERVAYVPFKVNLAEFLADYDVVDDRYYLAAGVTQRDWDTLLEAWKEIPARLIISMPSDAEIRRRGLRTSAPDMSRMPANAMVVRHGPAPDEWLRLLARARALVLPIRGSAINPAGISTALTAMALGKPVVISQGPSSDGILTEGRAVLVPSGDADALRAAVLGLERDAALRVCTACAGRRYAAECGTTARLHEDYLRLGLAASRTRGGRSTHERS